MLLALVAVCACLLWKRDRGEPKTLAEVLQAGEAAGMTVVSVREDGKVIDSAVLAIVPTSVDEACQLPAGDFDSPRWVGRVMVRLGVEHLTPGNFPPANLRRIGRCWVYGDPAVLAMLE